MKTAGSAKSKAPKAAEERPSTVVFGESLEKRNFVKIPRALIYIRAFDDPVAKKIKPRHIHLVLALAGRKFGKKMIRRYWARVAGDLGISPETARKWAYELKKLKLIKIVAFTGKTKLPGPVPKKSMPVGFRNEANGFILTPLIELMEKAALDMKAKREQRYSSRLSGGSNE